MVLLVWRKHVLEKRQSVLLHVHHGLVNEGETKLVACGQHHLKEEGVEGGGGGGGGRGEEMKEAKRKGNITSEKD